LTVKWEVSASSAMLPAPPRPWEWIMLMVFLRVYKLLGWKRSL
jgi:hypothetical protein